MPVWDAEVVIDSALVRALIREQFPELDASSARPFAEGWDNAVWLVEERWAFRFPRREIAIPGVERELVVLPRLAPLLPVPVPVPTFVGEPSRRFPWPFFGAELLRGREPAEAELDDADRVELGVELGRFLRVLHASELPEAVDPSGELPVDPLGRGDMAKRVPMAQQFLADLGPSWAGERRAWALLERASRLAPPDENVFLHGDLHIRHVLVESGSLAAVIDWGDTCVGDPAIDLLLVWSLLPPAGRERFQAEYGPVDEERRLRARVVALSVDAALALYAHDTGNARLRREALAGLERSLVDWD